MPDRATRTSFVLFLLTLILTVLPARAQQAISTATITGVVKDNQGLAVPGATITVTNEQTKAVRVTVSNESGTFNVPALLPGKYGLTVSLTGFRTLEQQGISLQSN